MIATFQLYGVSDYIKCRSSSALEVETYYSYTPNFAIYSPETGFFKQSFTNSYKNVVFLIIEASPGGNYPNLSGLSTSGR